MRKSLTVLLVLAVLAVGFLAAAAPAVDRQETAVEITEERYYGDPAAGEGLRLGVKTAMDGYLHWATAIDLGPEITWDTDFSYTASRTGEYSEPDPYFYLYPNGGGGTTSTSYGGDLNLTDTGDPFDRILQDVATRAPAGTENYTETVRLSDYLAYYPIGVDYYFDGDEAYWWPGEDGIWPGAAAFFHLPVDDDTMVATISKAENGNVYSAGWEQMETPSLDSASACVDGGAYVAIWGGMGNDGLDQPLPEGAAETGVYWIPVTAVLDEYGSRMARVDEDGVALVWQPEDGICVGLWPLDGGAQLLAQVSTETGEEMQVVDTAAMEVVQTFPLDYDRDGWTQLYVEEDHVVTLTGRSEEQADGEYAMARQWVEAWHRGEDGRYERTVSCDLLPAEIQWSYGLTTWCDGERLVLSSLVDGYSNPSAYVAVCDGTGLRYAARLNHSQAWDPHLMNRVQSAADVTVGRAE